MCAECRSWGWVFVPQRRQGFLSSFLPDESVVRLRRAANTPNLNSENNGLRPHLILRDSVFLWSFVHCTAYFMSLQRLTLHSSPLWAVWGWCNMDWIHWALLPLASVWVWQMGGAGKKSEGSRKARWIFLFPIVLPARLQLHRVVLF